MTDDGNTCSDNDDDDDDDDNVVDDVNDTDILASITAIQYTSHQLAPVNASRAGL